MKKIRIGTRDSKLAMIQTQIVADSIKKYDSSIEIEIVPMKTTGDIILDKTLDKIGGKGLFVKELDKALLDEKVDITVHSMKDMPMELDARIPILATGKRENPCDVLVLPKGKSLEKHLPIGSSSARRNIQLRKLFPDFDIKPVRGNVLTRLEKLDRGEYSALVLASAGLQRLGLEDRISEYFSVEQIIPANCQAVIAVQGRADFPKEILSEFHSEQSFITSLCERAFVRELNGGCSAPIAAYAKLSGDQITLSGLYVVEKEFEHYKTEMERGNIVSLNIYQGSKTASKSQARQLGMELAAELKSKA
ncbi:MAG: hydroxymethylbilane synthase [Peptostreptococcaceae bacterium]|nr:hydroxymethylbilane synthase [Peptostreptococcaceae bacterium]